MSKTNFLKKLQINPIWQSLSEAIFMVLFTFLPVALIAIPLADRNDQFQNYSFTSVFLSYWSSGQITLPVLGLCGAIAALLVTNFKKLNGCWFFCAIILCALPSLICGYILSESNGFSKELYSSVTTFGFFLYFIVLLFWLFLLIKSRASIPKNNFEDRAKNILNERNKMAQGN
ncbi:hypothetical protein [Vreelandella malpeensis]|uniref:Uncharacterized protein n=1 Tax=Vreelandella malpeensis TaxID=1172368 RepID=A0ABS8DPJ9_9GAMM|nr:hypothetical protein [Halomonas malpeensis]MCB8887953.1 hypothetical protein [Halomonas malpeensis]